MRIGLKLESKTQVNRVNIYDPQIYDKNLIKDTAKKLQIKGTRKLIIVFLKTLVIIVHNNYAIVRAPVMHLHAHIHGITRTFLSRSLGDRGHTSR